LPIARKNVARPTEQYPGFLLRKVANILMGELAGQLAPHGIRVTEAAALIVLQSCEELTSSQIGKTLDIQSANMPPLLNRLDTAGLIYRKPIDGKSQAIMLTPEGQAKAEIIASIVAEFEQSILSRIPEEHRDHLLPALNALLH
jgi:DNA-binding MarR family transcriptional regulator